MKKSYLDFEQQIVAAFPRDPELEQLSSQAYELDDRAERAGRGVPVNTFAGIVLDAVRLEAYAIWRRLDDGGDLEPGELAALAARFRRARNVARLLGLD